jgi:hypothetical protein
LALCQSISSEVLFKAGDHYQNGTIQLSWVLVEPALETQSNTITVLAKGVHPTNLSAVAVHEFPSVIYLNAFHHPLLNVLSVEIPDVVLASSPLGIKLSDTQTSTAGTIVYEELFAQTTNAYGLVNLVLICSGLESPRFIPFRHADA